MATTKKTTTKTATKPATKRAAKVEPTTMVRQGDVLVFRTDTIPTGIEPVPADKRGIVLAEGETSAHYHVVIGGKAKLSRFTDRRNTDRVLVVTGPAKLCVIGGGAGGKDRHGAIPITAGTYFVRTQRAADSANVSRQVND